MFWQLCRVEGRVLGYEPLPTADRRPMTPPGHTSPRVYDLSLVGTDRHQSTMDMNRRPSTICERRRQSPITAFALPVRRSRYSRGTFPSDLSRPGPYHGPTGSGLPRGKTP